MPSLSSLVSIETFTEWQNTNDDTTLKTLKVLYTSMPGGPGNQANIVKENPSTYIPNSILFDFQGQFADASSPLANTMVNAIEFATQASALGLSESDTIVIYDDYGNFCASRVWFMFKSMGHNKVFVLDGGLPLYLQMNLPTSNSLTVDRKKKNIRHYICKPNPMFTFIDKNYILHNLETKEAIVADARANPRFLGNVPEAKENLRAGHIPGSVNIHYADLQDENGKFLPIDDLKEIFAPFRHKPLVFSCGSGVTACILAHGATLAGIKKLKVYDGSWSEWGADPILPIESGQS